jgi:acyl CoA:acetate/3-ketoacid CoA transferase
LEKDILNQMEFKPIISPALKQMDPRIFSTRIPMGIRSEILAKNGNGARSKTIAVK